MDYFGISNNQNLNRVIALMPPSIILDLEHGIQHIRLKSRWFYQIRLRQFEYMDLVKFCRMIVKKYNVQVYHTDSVAQSNNVSKIITRIYGKKSQTMTLGYADRSCGIFIPKASVRSLISSPTYDPLNLPLPTTVEDFYQTINTLPQEDRGAHVTNLIRVSLIYPIDIVWRSGEIAVNLIQDLADHIDFQMSDSILPYLSNRDIASLPILSRKSALPVETIVINSQNDSDKYKTLFPMLTAESIGDFCRFLDFLVLINQKKNNNHTDVLQGFFAELSKTSKDGRFFIRVANQRVTIDYLLPPTHSE